LTRKKSTRRKDTDNFFFFFLFSFFFFLKFGSVEILFFPYSFILCGSLENNPLSPPEGEATQGEHPLDPLFFSGYISTLSGVIAIGEMPKRRGRKHEKLEPPRAIVCFYEDFNRA
jgi:hypothetical protein